MTEMGTFPGLCAVTCAFGRSAHGTRLDEQTRRKRNLRIEVEQVSFREAIWRWA